MRHEPSQLMAHLLDDMLHRTGIQARSRMRHLLDEVIHPHILVDSHPVVAGRFPLARQVGHLLLNVFCHVLDYFRFPSGYKVSESSAQMGRCIH